MANSFSRVYLDTRFVEGTSVGADAIMDITFNQPDNFGEKYLPTIFEVGSTSFSTIDAPIEYGFGVTASGENSIFTEFSANDIDFSFIVNLVNFSTNNVQAFYTEKEVCCEINSSLVSGSINSNIEIIAGDIYNYFNRIPIDFWIYDDTFISQEIINNYTNFTGHYLGPDPVPFYDLYNLFQLSFVLSEEKLSVIDTNVDLTFAGWITNNFKFDLFCNQYNTKFFDFEITTASGGELKKLDFDIFSVNSDILSINSDLFSCLVDLSYLESSITVVSGSISNFEWDVYSCSEIKNSIVFDVNLLSLYISNFSLDVGEFIYTDQVLSVDVTDDVYSVITSGTYFMIDGVQVPVTFSGIDNGYRMYFDSENNFENLSGPAVITIVAENDIGQSYSKDYYVTFGYVVEYLNKKIDFGLGKRIGVRLAAEDNASCPTFSTDGYWFEVIKPWASDLSAYIYAIPEDHKDLMANIVPKSTAYFYGKVFRVVLTCKDFAGNEMEPFVFEYKIEDKPVIT